jgi:hypothetical protein
LLRAVGGSAPGNAAAQLFAWLGLEHSVPEGLSASEVGKEITEHREHTSDEHARADRGGHHRLLSIVEAVLLSIVALMAAWSGYSAAKWVLTHQSR